MAKNPYQKLKLAYLYMILLRESDPDHPIPMHNLLEKLASYGVKAERKSIYDDIAALENVGIVVEHDRRGNYYLDTRLFDMPELKMLVDAVQSARFLTEAKSRDIIQKLESTVSHYDARKLSRQTYVADRPKTMNKAVITAVDAIHNAINDNKQIRFHYFYRNMKKETILRHDGKFYYVSPFSLAWSDDNYYLIAFDGESRSVRHYRVDRMQKTCITEKSREGKETFENFDMATYAKSLFGMYAGESTLVRLSCDESLVDVILDRFGDDVTLIPDGENRFSVTVNVMVSPNFLSYTLGFGDKMRIVSPQNVVESLKNMIADGMKNYGM